MNVYYIYYTGILWYTKKHRISWEKTQIMFTSCSKGVCCHVTNAIFPRNYLFQNILVSIYQYLKLLKKNTCSWICRTARKKQNPSVLNYVCVCVCFWMEDLICVCTWWFQPSSKTISLTMSNWGTFLQIGMNMRKQHVWNHLEIHGILLQVVFPSMKERTKIHQSAPACSAFEGRTCDTKELELPEN